MERALAIFVMLAILSILIIVHECGHFLVARFFGFQTPVFGFGLPFGPYVAIGRRWNTEFRIYALVLGGFVAIPELGDESAVSEDVFGIKLNPFKKFPIYQRMLVAVAGVSFNVIFAYFLTVAMLYTIGKPIQNVGVRDLPPENPIARQAGVMVKDEIMSIDARSIGSPDDVVSYLTSHKNTAVVLHLRRDGKMVDVPVTTNAEGRIGMALDVGPAQFVKVEGNPVQICGSAYSELSTKTGQMVQQIGQLFANLVPKLPSKNAPKKAGPGIQDFHGVLAVIKIGSDIALMDWRQLVITTILISMDLAIVNLLPWPALDGGHLAFMTLEAIRRKPMDEHFQGEIVKWGFLSLLVLMVVVMVNDVTALVTGKLDLKAPDEKPAVKKEVKPEAEAKPSNEDAQKKVVSPNAKGTPVIPIVTP